MASAAEEVAEKIEQCTNPIAKAEASEISDLKFQIEETANTDATEHHVRRRGDDAGR
jgi:hypothetical protein